MKRDIYSCDLCGTVLSDEHLDSAIPHLSIVIGQNSGVATNTPCWSVARIPPGIYQFCLASNLWCLREFFRKYVLKEGLEDNMFEGGNK